MILGAAMIDSSPQGASFQVDGKNDPSWVPPFNVTGLTPGKHIISVSKPGYSSDVHSVDVASGNKSSLMLHLSPVNALMVVNSTPVGAEVILDGKPTGRVTRRSSPWKKEVTPFCCASADISTKPRWPISHPLRISSTHPHSELWETPRTCGPRPLQQAVRPRRRECGRPGFHRVRTVPKGAQVAIDQQVLERTSPVGVALGPGNYIVDITLTGFKPVHKVVSIDKGNRAAIDEILERQ